MKANVFQGICSELRSPAPPKHPRQYHPVANRMEKKSGITAHSGTLDASQEYAIRPQSHSTQGEEHPKKPWWYSIREPGSALQIVSAAAVAIAIGLAVSSTVDDIPYAAPTIIEIPGALWLRALRAAGTTSTMRF
jgi:hypothetical protein